MALVAIGGGGLAVWSLRDGDAAPTAPTPAMQPTVAMVDAGAAQVVVAAAAADASTPHLDAAELETDARVPATTPVKKPVGTPRTSPPRDVKTVVTGGSATPPTTPATTAPPPPALGWLAIELTPWGTFRLPNQAPLTTPRKVQLPPGDYPITMTFSESGATIRGTATVTANATTRCKGTPAEGLSCQR
ncbi:MAG: hypothetical protein IPQ07_43460 [Myxococcales bacterium]|nr:hypothetical protein [Myxococcales bacterium]